GSPLLSPPRATLPAGKQVAPISQGNTDTASSPQSFFTLVATRADSAAVATISPLFQVNPLNVPGESGAAATLAATRNASSELANRSGSAGASPEAVGAFVRELESLYGETERTVRKF